METAFERKRKVRATVGQYDPNPLGYTRIAMVKPMGSNSERRSQSPIFTLVRIEACNSAS